MKDGEEYTCEPVYRQKLLDKTHECITKIRRIGFGRNADFLQSSDFFRCLTIGLTQYYITLISVLYNRISDAEI